MISGSKLHQCICIRFFSDLQQKSIIWLISDLPISHSMLNIEFNPSLTFSRLQAFALCQPVREKSDVSQVGINKPLIYHYFSIFMIKICNNNKICCWYHFAYLSPPVSVNSVMKLCIDTLNCTQMKCGWDKVLPTMMPWKVMGLATVMIF